MDFIQELKWRKMLQDHTPGLIEELKKPMVVGYIGFDPTAPSLTIGNLVQIQLLKLFQLSGHKPIVLMGGATGRIGDPSGKDKERVLKTEEELEANLQRQKAQFRKFLDFDNGENRAIIANNYDFYADMNVLSFLRNVGKLLTINYMMSKESVKRRIETGISFTEFSYQLLQGYDFQMLFEKYGCTVQFGGSDQWGNITAGTEIIRKKLGKNAFAVTTPLLLKPDGRKFGKSEEGNIWLDPDMTSPYKFYQFWLRTDDAQLPLLLRYFSLKSQEEVEALEATYADNPQALKRILAEELTVRVHSRAAYESVMRVSEILFNKKASRDTLFQLTAKDFEDIAQEIPTFNINKSTLDKGIHIVDLMAAETKITVSKGEARRAIQGKAVAINKAKVESIDTVITTDALLHGKYIMVENGKKNKFLLTCR